MIQFLVIWLVMGLFVAALASEFKKRNFLPWFIYGFAIWPVALIHVLCLETPTEEAPSTQSNDDTSATEAAPPPVLPRPDEQSGHRYF